VGRGFYQMLADRVRLQDVAIMTRQLATLVGAGLPLMEALDALVEQLEKGGLKRVVAGVREVVREGGSLADALGRFPRVFSELYINMVRSGEASGTLDLMLLRLSDFLERQVQLRNKILATMAYPLIMLGIGSVILFMLVTFVVPQVTSVFEEMHQVLPLPTRILLGVSHFLRDFWWLLFLLIGLALFLFKRWVKTPNGRERYDRWLLELPLVGSLFKRVALSRFTTTLSTLLSSGVPLLRSLEIVKEVENNRILAQAIHAARENIKEGESIAEPLKRSGVFPPMVTRMIAVGERSGELEKVLLKVSEAYDHEVETLVTTLTSLLTPVMILVMGAIVLYIVVSILLPVFEMSQVIH
jgi:general secretion pathway protein F